MKRKQRTNLPTSSKEGLPLCTNLVQLLLRIVLVEDIAVVIVLKDLAVVETVHIEVHSLA